MSEQMKVTAKEHGLVRIFGVDLPEEEAKSFSTRDFDDNDGNQDRWPLRDALNAKYLDEDFVEFFDVADLEDLGLAGYMIQGLGISNSDVAEARTQIDAITGHVLIVLSNAFGGFEQTLDIQSPLRWIGTFAEEGSPVNFEPLNSAAAKGNVVSEQPVSKPNPHLNVLAAILALPLLICIAGLVIWLLL